jgi:hypothetical protein
MATAAADDDATLDTLDGSHRRTRMTITADPQVKAWLRRTASCHAHLCYIVRLFGKPETAGGQSLQGEDFAARAARGDRTLLYDAMGYVADQVAEIREEIAREMRNAPATAEMPGTTAKVRVMIERAETGRDLFIDGDAQTDVR